MRSTTRIIYTSSYDRGLQHLLEMWPNIKKEVPEATLEVYYGWLLFHEFYKNNPASMEWEGRMKTLMKQEGVIDHDRISQDELKEEYKKAGVWAYPTHFGEINCISGIKAQAYGAVPCVINYAALKETVQFGIKIEGDIYDKEVQTIYKDKLIWLLKNPDWQEEVRVPMMKWATDQFPWEKVAKQWDKEFRDKKTSDFLTVPDNKVLKIFDGYSGKEIV